MNRVPGGGIDAGANDRIELLATGTRLRPPRGFQLQNRKIRIGGDLDGNASCASFSSHATADSAKVHAAAARFRVDHTLCRGKLKASSAAGHFHFTQDIADLNIAATAFRL